jgi:surface antigen
MDSLAKNLMGVGKSFLISAVLAVSATAYAGPLSAEGPTYGSEWQFNPWGGLANLFRTRASYLNDSDRESYIQAVTIALEQTQNGEIVEWWSKYNDGNHGYVRVVQTIPTGSGYCRVYQSAILYDGKEYQYTEQACVQAGTRGRWYYGK